MRNKLEDPALGKWPSILSSELTEAQLSGRNSPCPIHDCGGKDRFRFDNREGRGTWICTHCGAGDGWSLLMKLTGKPFKDLADKIRHEYESVKPTIPVKPDPRPMLNRMWVEAESNSREVAEYLMSRGLPAWMSFDPELRFHPRCAWSDGNNHGYAPAMLARVYQDGKPQTLHRTFLTTDVPIRKMLMPHAGHLNGCYIPLGNFGNLPPNKDVLGVAEGIETALAARALLAHQNKTINATPMVWPTYCASQLERFNKFDNVSRLLIFADNDGTFTGQAAAFGLAKRAINFNMKCSVFIPPNVQEDFNDVVRRGGSLSEVATYGVPPRDGVVAQAVG